MLKRLLLLAGAALALVTAVSADIPVPPCAPDCVLATAPADIPVPPCAPDCVLGS
jgi:hypothetical protein